MFYKGLSLSDKVDLLRLHPAASRYYGDPNVSCVNKGAHSIVTRLVLCPFNWVVEDYYDDLKKSSSRYFPCYNYF